MRFKLIESLRSLFNSKSRAIKKDPFSIVLLDNPSEKLLSTAVRKDSRVFLLLKNPSEKVSRTAISKNPSFIKLIPNPSETLQLLAISKDPTQIVNIKKPTLKTQLKVVTASPECINLIENPSIETIKVYVGNDYKRFWDLKLSNVKQEKVFNELFRGKESWNIPTEELITWLSNYTNIKVDNLKDIYNTDGSFLSLIVLSLIDVSPLLINSLIWSVLISSSVRLFFFNSPNSSISVIFFFVPFRHSRRCVCWDDILSTSGVIFTVPSNLTFSFLIPDCFSI